jgi:8-oxo-dGTP pyrophosphatase MutT (NUDIX family)
MSVTQVGVKCLLLSGDHSRFLALRRASGVARQREEFDIPGGRLEYGEEPVAGLAREILEEVGLSLPNAERFALVDAGNVVADAERHIVRLTYAYVLESDDLVPMLSDEHTEWCWREVGESDGYHPLLNRAIRHLRNQHTRFPIVGNA